MSGRSLGRWLVAWVAMAGAPACMFEIEDGHHHHGVHGYGHGILTAEWTVDGWSDPEACYDFGARDFELIVYGSVDTEIEARCDEFVLSLEVPEGRYAIDATLVDRHDHAVTTTLALDDVYVYAGEELVIPIDFPPDTLL